MAQWVRLIYLFIVYLAYDRSEAVWGEIARQHMFGFQSFRNLVLTKIIIVLEIKC